MTKKVWITWHESVNEMPSPEKSVMVFLKHSDAIKYCEERTKEWIKVNPSEWPYEIKRKDTEGLTEFLVYEKDEDFRRKHQMKEYIWAFACSTALKVVK